MNFISIDPGNPTGISVFDSFCRLFYCETIKYENALQYYADLLFIRNGLEIRFALIEGFIWFHGKFKKGAYRVQTQVQLCCEIFPDYININPAQWCPPGTTEKYKKLLAEQTFQREFSNSHERDSALMGKRIFDIVYRETENGAFNALLSLAQNQRRFPTKAEKRPWIE